MTSAIVGYGASLTIDGVSVAQLTRIGEIQFSREMRDVTAHDSTGGYQEFIPAGKKGYASIPVEGFYKLGDSGQGDALAAAIAGTNSDFVITWPSGTSATFTFSGYVENFVLGELVDEGQTFSCSLVVSGVPTGFAETDATAPSDIVVTGNVGGALTLVPSFAGTTYTYVADGSSNTSVTVTVTAASANTITVNGNSVSSGVASGSISLTSGQITTITVVVGETGKVSRTYTFYISG